MREKWCIRRYFKLSIDYIVHIHWNILQWINLASLSVLGAHTPCYHEWQTLKPRTSAISRFCKIFMWKVYGILTASEQAAKHTYAHAQCSLVSVGLTQAHPNYGTAHLATALLMLHGVKCFSTNMAGIKIEQERQQCHGLNFHGVRQYSYAAWLDLIGTEQDSSSS